MKRNDFELGASMQEAIVYAAMIEAPFSEGP
jgi:hypothetical protein